MLSMFYAWKGEGNKRHKEAQVRDTVQTTVQAQQVQDCLSSICWHCQLPGVPCSGASRARKQDTWGPKSPSVPEGQHLMQPHRVVVFEHKTRQVQLLGCNVLIQIFQGVQQAQLATHFRGFEGGEPPGSHLCTHQERCLSHFGLGFVSRGTSRKLGFQGVQVMVTLYDILCIISIVQY